MEPSNSSLFPNHSQAQVGWNAIWIAYAVCGLTTIVANILIFVIVFSDQKLREKSALVIGVAGSNMLWGLAVAAVGLFRLVIKASDGRRVSAWFCVGLVFPLFMPLACQTLSVMMCVVGIDRVLATASPNWYYKNWTSKRSWLTVLAAYAIAVSPLIWGLSEAWRSSTPATFSCALPSVFGSRFTSWFFGLTVAGGTAAVMLTLIAYYCSMKRISKLPLLNGDLGRLKRQLQLTRAMFTISSMDFVLVVLPAAVACYANATELVHPQTVLSVCNIVYCINGTAVIIPHLILNTKFREAAVKLFGLSRCMHNSVAPNTVVPATNRVGGQPTLAGQT